MWHVIGKLSASVPEWKQKLGCIKPIRKAIEENQTLDQIMDTVNCLGGDNRGLIDYLLYLAAYYSSKQDKH